MSTESLEPKTHWNSEQSNVFGMTLIYGFFFGVFLQKIILSSVLAGSRSSRERRRHRAPRTEHPDAAPRRVMLFPIGVHR